MRLAIFLLSQAAEVYPHLFDERLVCVAVCAASTSVPATVEGGEQQYQSEHAQLQLYVAGENDSVGVERSTDVFAMDFYNEQRHKKQGLTIGAPAICMGSDDGNTLTHSMLNNG